MSDIPSFYPGTSIADVMRLRAERDAAVARAETAEGGWQRERAARQRAEADADRLAESIRNARFVTHWRGAQLDALAAHDVAVAERGAP